MTDGDDLIEDLILENKTLRQALEWYAPGGGAWTQATDWRGHRKPYPILDDCGMRARAALTERERKLAARAELRP